MKILRAKFFDNYANHEGGAVHVESYYYVHGFVHIEDAFFINNKAGESGSAISSFHSNLTVLSTTFLNNGDKDTAGAFSVVNPSRIYINNCTFKENEGFYSINSEGHGTPAALDIHVLGVDGSKGQRQGHATILNTIFHKNEAGFGAVAISDGHNMLNVSILSSEFILNKNGALRIEKVAVNQISNCKFLANSFLPDTLELHGGAIYAKDAFIGIIETSTFTRNRAITGGAIYLDDTTLRHISSSDFTANVAQIQGTFTGNEDGGAIYIVSTYTNKDPIIVSECSFTNNGARGHGESIFVSPKAIMTIINSVFNPNFKEYEAFGDFEFEYELIEENVSVLVTGPLQRCIDSPCPAESSLCIDRLNRGLDFGVQCTLPCPLGQFGIGPADCNECPLGKYGAKADADQAEACRLCDAGKYSDMIGVTFCKPCSNGSWATLGSPQCFNVCSPGEQWLSNTTCIT